MKTRCAGWLAGLVMAMLAVAPVWGEAPAAANAGFDGYVGTVESRLTRQHAGQVLAPADEARLRRGELVIEKVDTPEVPDGMLHHWRATAFLPGATAADFERLIGDFPNYPKRFAPQVVTTTVPAQHGDRYQVQMRLRQKHVITVVMDQTYDVSFNRLGAGRGYISSVSTRIKEIKDAGTAHERALGAEEEHGFLWRQNTYWSYEQSHGGLIVQVNSVSLTRGIPLGLGWLIGPFIESVPRESLEFTLGRVREELAVRRPLPGLASAVVSSPLFVEEGK